MKGFKYSTSMAVILSKKYLPLYLVMYAMLSAYNNKNYMLASISKQNSPQSPVSKLAN
jgi:hypothetical protein